MQLGTRQNIASFHSGVCSFAIKVDFTAPSVQIKGVRNDREHLILIVEKRGIRLACKLFIADGMLGFVMQVDTRSVTVIVLW